jgi:hypothetical protein
MSEEDKRETRRLVEDSKDRLTLIATFLKPEQLEILSLVYADLVQVTYLTSKTSGLL